MALKTGGQTPVHFCSGPSSLASQTPSLQTRLGGPELSSVCVRSFVVYLCMWCACLHKCVCIRVHVCAQVCVCMNVCAALYVCMCIRHTGMYMHACVYACVHAHMSSTLPSLLGLTCLATHPPAARVLRQAHRSGPPSPAAGWQILAGCHTTLWG